MYNIDIQTTATAAKAAPVSQYNSSIIFPASVFPNAIRQYIEQRKTYSGWSKSHTGLTALMAASAAIGNTYRIKGKMETSASLNGVVVGQPGTAKTLIAEAGLREITNHHEESYRRFLDEKRGYQERLTFWKSLKPKERFQMGLQQPILPKFEKYKIDKTTPQAFGEALSSNRRSVLLYKDEITSFIKNVRNDMKEELLKCWSNVTYSSSAVTKAEIYITKPFLNIFGNIQNKRLDAFANNSGIESGFSMRSLFAFQDEGKRKLTMGDVDESVINGYDAIIRKLLNMINCVGYHGTPTPTVLTFEPNAFEMYEKWRNSFVERATEREDLYVEITSKMEQYSLRFALILQLLYWAANEEGKDEVGIRAVKGAIRLTEYFLNTSLLAHRQMITPTKDEKKAVKYEQIIQMFNNGGNYKSLKALGIHERDMGMVTKHFRHLLNNDVIRRLPRVAS